MKIKFVIVLVLAVVCLLLVVTGASTSRAQPFDRHPIHQQTISNTVYLPIVAKPPCTYVHPMAYVAVSKPVVRVGEYVTATGALVNICAPVGQPWYSIGTMQTDILSPSYRLVNGYPPYVLYNSYQEVTITMQATATGVATITFGALWETEIPAHQDHAVSSPVVMYVLP